ncbi:VOC family protein [Thalassococcus sp. CAU 1522]|uniref:VOC family protein n=1 Tax=Thalassococcus arenae TaxID=2851652 RepID=A0ABS6N902_9RHOB|nr:VOC family protein [Thalassococcus arenae]MBV2360486.1 VOC family protein [Thalassococcus arenae]
MLVLDHLAVLGQTLTGAVQHVEEVLDVSMLPGGAHPRFGTHNRLLGLAPGLYLEAIAIDPSAPDPGRPRWFGLDGFTGPARLDKWICRVDDLDKALALLPEAGEPVALERGSLNWRMAVPPDGLLPYDGLFPALIEWQSDVPPGKALPGSGCALRRLVVSHPDATNLAGRLGGFLDAPEVVFETGAPGLRADIDTPAGPVVLR